MKNNNRSIDGKYLIAHRGGRGEKPENTLESFEYAIDLNCAGIEFDIHLCKTNELVIFHNFIITSHLNPNNIPIKDMSLSEIQSINSDIPTLDAFFLMIEKKTIPQNFVINIEIKDFWIVSQLIKNLGKYNFIDSENLIISSILHSELLQFSRKMPFIKVAPIYKGMPLHAHRDLKVLNSNIIVICGFAITHETLNILKFSDSSIQIWVYTINTKDEANRLLNLGVNRIITDFPLKLIQ